MSTASETLVARLWNLCNVLKDDGVTYHQYVNELTYILFLKMANETGMEQQLPTGYRWPDLIATDPSRVLEQYRETISYLARYGSPVVAQIFTGTNTSIRKPHTLWRLLSEVDKLDWFSAQVEGLGDVYEGLLERNASEIKSGAGQYFTPRPLIDSIVAVTKPALGDVIQDPAAGTGGFLIAASKYIRSAAGDRPWSPIQRRKFQHETFYGMEHVQDTQRLALMNLVLHDIVSEPTAAGVRYGDTLSHEGQDLPPSTLVLSNPPFGSKKGGGLPARTDLPYPTSNKQLCFLQHIYGSLSAGGRAAVVLPDNVLFEGNSARSVRAELMETCNLHTILKLPTGIFYAQGVNTNVLFFTKGAQGTVDNTRQVWIYDLRTGVPPFGRRNKLNREFFHPFEVAFGSDPLGSPESLARRTEDSSPTGRFRRFSRQDIKDREDNLNISWRTGGTSDDTDTSQDPNSALRETIGLLEDALAPLRRIQERLEQRATKL